MGHQRLSVAGCRWRRRNRLFAQTVFAFEQRIVLQQFLDFLTDVRSAIGAESTILVGLVGKPDGTPLARPPKEIEADVWRKKVIGLGDPNLEVLSFVNPE
jgi:hypothetical protein